MFPFFEEKKTQTERVLELLLKHGRVTSLQLSQMHPVILNFHNALMELRLLHNIETVSELVKGKKHTAYIYHGRKLAPMPREKVKHFLKEDIIRAFEAWANLEAPNGEAYLETL